MIELEEIKAKTATEKHSMHLYKFLKRNGMQQVWLFHKKGEVPEMDFVKQFPHIFLGVVDSNGFLFGKKLKNIHLGFYGSQSMRGELLKEGIEATEITEEFYEKYKSIGICAYQDHTTRMYGNEDRYWLKSRNRKICRWCGLKMARRVKTVCEKIETWEVLS